MNSSLLGAVCASLFIFVTTSTSAAFSVSQWSSSVDTVSREVTFNILFNEVPDFFTTDEYGRQAHAFQYYIDVDSGIQPVPERLADTIIRGEEIHFDGDIRIRESCAFTTCPDFPKPESAGWGPELGSVPYTLNGSRVAFTAPWDYLQTSDGNFSYKLLLTEYGGSSDRVFALSGESHVVPIPAASWLLGSGLLGLVSIAKRKKVV